LPQAEASAAIDLPVHAEVREFAVQLGRRGDDQAADLLPGLGAGLDRATPSDLQDPDRLDDTLAALR
jgi:hypothetical protein